MDSKELYAALASEYDVYAEGRRKYLDAVDAFIIRQNPVKHGAFLDVGAGTGHRGLALAHVLNSSKIVQIDNSEAMASTAYDTHGIVVLNADPADETSMEKICTGFQNIVCLWNVLGHVPEHSRKQFLKSLRDRLLPNGRLFMDVNNRHNIRAYGVKVVIKNLANDLFKPGPKNGDVSFPMKLRDGEAVRASGHIFSRKEIHTLFKTSGLRIEKEAFIDYATGAEHSSHLSGQLVYMLKR